MIENKDVSTLVRVGTPLKPTAGTLNRKLHRFMEQP
jgi:hypothetical protein